jgi:hypothetical protein
LDGWIDVATPAGAPPARGALDVLHSSSWGEISARLVDQFLTHVAEIIPVVTRAQAPSASQFVRNAMAAVAAARSDVPVVVFEALRHLVQWEIEENGACVAVAWLEISPVEKEAPLLVADTIDALCIPTMENIQALLIVCLVDELAIGPRAASPSSVVRSRIAAAVRHARDIGFDRSSDKDEERVWRCARVMDIWWAAKSGMAPLVPVKALPLALRGDFDSQLLALSLIFGYMLGLIYGRDGVQGATNEQLFSIKDALNSWRDLLPEHLRPSSQWSGREGGEQNAECNSDLTLWLTIRHPPASLRGCQVHALPPHDAVFVLGSSQVRAKL